jgi:methionine synthase I (cobalamin-dependent)
MSVVAELVARAPVLTDGAWGTELLARGLKPGDCPDEWNLSRPRQVEEVAESYVAAGSRVILTNTFRSNRITLAGHGLAGKTAQLNRAGAAISKRAAGARAKVFASIGPSGKMLMAGETTEEELREAFAEQARALAEGGADALVVETMSDLAEARIALQAAKSTGLPVVACMVFDTGKNKDRTMMGATPEQAAAELTGAGADAIGANCGVGIESYVPICRRLRSSTDRPVWIKANAGLPELVEGRAVWRMTPEEFAGFVPPLVEAGASFIGGCCGTSPAFIRALARAVDG